MNNGQILAFGCTHHARGPRHHAQGLTQRVAVALCSVLLAVGAAPNHRRPPSQKPRHFGRILAAHPLLRRTVDRVQAQLGVLREQATVHKQRATHLQHSWVACHKPFCHNA